MKQEDLDESIEMIFFSGNADRRPLRFRWQDRVFRIASTNGYWMRHEGNCPYHYWAVTDASGDYYEVELNGETLDWKLKRIVQV